MQIDLRFKKKINKFYLKEFNYICNVSIDEFNQFFETISLNQKLDWWLSSAASRYNLSSPLFHNFCIFKFLEYLNNTNNLPNSIIIDSYAVDAELRKFILFNKINLEIILVKKKYFKIKSFIRNYIIFFHQLFYRLCQYFIVKFIINSKKIPNNFDKNILIDKYIFPGYEIKERYYNGLTENLDNNLTKIYFVPTSAMIKIKDLYKTYNILKNSDNNYLIKENFYSLKSIFYSLFHFFRKNNLNFNSQLINGIEFSKIIKEELDDNSIAFFAAVEGFLTIEFIKKIKSSNIKLYKIIDWYENQTIDKAWNFGFNTHYPDVKSLGYKGMAPSQMLLSEIYTLNIERQNNLLPKEIGVIGKGFKEESQKYNFITPIIVCPAFRFNYLWKYKKNIINKKKIILFALPISIDQSIQILSNLNYFNNKDHNYDIYIKPHPTSKIDIYINYLKNINFINYSIVKIPTEQILPNITFVVGGMSSISLESICLGIKTILIENNSGINYFTIPKNINKKNYKISKYNQNLLNLIIHYDKEINLSYVEITKIKKLYFEPINAKSIHNFLN